tara:strand:- start:750 stop:914 length:165 start_codon:yes stop_codon:yes gene_type:complete
MLVLTLAPMTLGREKLPVGSTIELSDYSAQKLAARGLVEPAPKPKKKAKKPIKE